LSKTISIREGNTIRTPTVSKIKVNLSGEGTAIFIPEDDAQAAIVAAKETEYAALLAQTWGTNSMLGTWVLNDSINGSLPQVMSIDFNCGAATYHNLAFSGNVIYYDSVYVYSMGWVSNDYKTITITGGSDVENDDLYNWLNENGVKQ